MTPYLHASHSNDDNDLSEQLKIYSAEDETSRSREWPDDLINPPPDYTIEREQIRVSGARNLLDILKTFPGFDVSLDSNGHYHVSTRGIRDDSRTWLWLDGHPIRNAYTGQNFWEIPADLIERVEVYGGYQVYVTTRRQEGLDVHMWIGSLAGSAASITFGHRNRFLDAFAATQFNLDALSAVSNFDLLLSRQHDIHLTTHAQFFMKPSLTIWKADTGFELPYGNHNRFQFQVFASQYQTLNFGAEIDNLFHFADSHALNFSGHIDVAQLSALRRISTYIQLAERWRILPTLQSLIGIRLLSFSDTPLTFWNVFNPEIDIALTPHPKWALDFRFNTRPRLPTLQDKYDQTDPIFKGNPQLKPEHISSLQAHVRYQIDDNHQQYILEGLLYGSKTSDAIEKLDENGSDNIIRNAATYYVMGIEAQSRINFLGNNYLFFNLGWFRGYWNQTRWSLVTHLPQLRGTMGFNLALPSIGSLNTTIELGSERRNNIRTDLERQRPYQIPPYTLINVAFLTKPILKYFVLEGRVFNLFNFQNRDDLLRPDTFPNLVPREGLTWYIGLLAMI